MPDTAKTETYTLIATCAAGLEDLVQAEVVSFGGQDIVRARGSLTWQGDLASAYRACLWSRYASRVLLQLAEFTVADDTELYQHCGAINWQEHLDLGATFAIDCTLSEKASLPHSQYAALRVKDALVDQFRDLYGERPSVQVDQPDVQIRLHVHGDQATLTLDLSGESLHRRGYRVAGTIAPLKESLAAGIVALAGWNKDVAIENVFLDPMCGSGTLLIEAALLYGDSAPGLGRKYFGFMGWKGHDEELWSQLVRVAVAREEAGMDRPWPMILGYDADPVAVAAARKNIEQAGLTERIRVKQGQLANLKRPAAKGFLVCNPPYGERLNEEEEAVQLYRALGRVAREEFSGWRVGIFIASPDFADRIGLAWQASHRLFNGPLACRLFCADVPLIGAPALIPESSPLPEKAGEEILVPDFHWQVAPASFQGEGADFANRLVKNLKKILKWAEREEITCFRVYDRDLPEYNVTIDLYGKWIHVQEYAPPATIDPELAAERFRMALAMIREVLGVRRDRIFIKTRKKQKGKEQYQKQGSRRKMHEVREGHCFFLVNFTDYLDTGLFLDHRITRHRIGELAVGKRFLNLFGYTGTATIHAARGGAETTTTVDLSATYLGWARMNLALNGYGGPAHLTIQEDCLRWLEDPRGQYDLIFVDPPTFSNTKKENRVFDVQRDHGQLLDLAMRHLAPGGLLIFSTNFRKFVLDEALGLRFAIRDISRETVPLDFERNSRIHQCWEFRSR
jgi:23S rRNA (guanine2445-N2)-methyltransferase / 23S rRNA (guanine2069-N7)-methyltransferase